ncbi:flagellar FlbD family protein [Serpentinicella sp. ANB-PHB4]|uniref:flagellar FlbD family protein n=1 Tax=Serpentinicella sp. ANB-PHB4 TaxID=3074076 RepID=UPI0028675543|nr:flagellar FlbD family protein [Serpentinicella sp. ANB-PHB4]MDR5658262.1 flagellar FlbD family protein [Serpentinicella sp. ANB-PHB4]
MIKLKRFNNTDFILNAELIQTVEETPDTMITLINGQKILVLENSDEVVNRIIEYKRKIFTNYAQSALS